MRTPAFFFNDTATTEIYTLSLHDALPISPRPWLHCGCRARRPWSMGAARSEEHTSELQSPVHLVCRLLLEKKKIEVGDECVEKQRMDLNRLALDEHRL